MGDEEFVPSASTAIDSSNVGFKLLKKCGWKEGTGLGVSEQGMLEPIPTLVKTNKRGIGADRLKKKVEAKKDPDDKVQKKHESQSKRKNNQVSKRIRKMHQEEERMKEKEFERAFFREFWPDNV
ncbi:G patch domain and ankyrin repeat-containing protein [Canna indica]|uniref:G patch domain and ankyrin repeat-containing protein n=1 Tax=Canna indica TaxID=4628 RepID=A0AAQ3KJ46_9LILI|nr:G patch domain and ankyrin repeat-containing protein [Canna indica]